MTRAVVVGGTRSGKSDLARRRAAAASAPVVVVATGSASDPEMAQRIAAHQRRRPADWKTVETTDLVAALQAAPADATVVVDDLDGWLADRMGAAGLWSDREVDPLDEAEERAAARVLEGLDAFWDAAAARPGLTAVVAGQPGWAPTPLGASTRRYLDLHGEALQRLTAAADEVVVAIAGRALSLEGAPWPACDPHAPGSASGASGRQGAGSAPGAAGLPAALREHGDTQVPAGCLDLAVNVLHGPPGWLADRLAARMGDLAAYPDPGPARAAAAARHQRPPGECLLLGGAAEGLHLLARVLRPRLAACVHPSFTEAEAALRLAGTPIVRVHRQPSAAWRLDPAAVPRAADLVVVGRPDSPTGVADAPAVIAGLCRPGRTVVVDEAFAEFLDDPSGLAGRRDLDGVVAVRSLTKLWGLAGLRVGYLVGPASLVARLGEARQPWPVSTLACEAVVALAAAETERAARASRVAAEREYLHAALAAIPGVDAWPGAANFLLLRTGRRDLRERLLDRGIAVRRGGTFPGLDDRYVRVAVRDRAASDRLAAAVASVLAGAG